ncbi:MULTISPECIES: 1,2-phenylacetyl-CoA epoxidase subunit PaaE [unclassified Haladaptatus]|uniref:1,2-phenylacetyl-CoA epoxidase subunit PaaE n=1 Tax=unclassified Haladaptatus TaxID=2622732 RepID=UPI002FCDE63A
MRFNDPSVTTSPDESPAVCPYCGSENTVRDHPKGPGLCRSMHYCNGCDQPFEKFG